MRRAVGLMVVLVLAIVGCGKDSSTDGGAGTGGPSTIGASGGATGASGMGVSGTGGLAAAAGAGGSAAGAGGAAAGSGGVAAGSGGAAGSMEAIPGCSAADATVTGSAAHAAALSVLGQMVPCGIGLCHGGMGQAKLVLSGAMDLKATLVGKAACEAPTLLLVDPQGGDAALANSWLWQKLTAPAVMTDALIVQPAWGTAAVCPTNGLLGGMTSGFGDRMPYGSLNTLDEPSLAKIRNWICAGAPGP
jgi:hypothetical protein